MLPHHSPGRGNRTGRGPRERQRLDFAWLEERALRYAARWEASAAGVANLLERKIDERCAKTDQSTDEMEEIDEAKEARTLIPAVVAALVERGYVDDVRFATGVLERQRRRGGSAAQIRLRLHAKGIADSLLDTLFEEEEPEAEITAAWQLARRRRLGPYCDDQAAREKSRERSLGILYRQGFDHETALQIIDADRRPESD